MKCPCCELKFEPTIAHQRICDACLTDMSDLPLAEIRAAHVELVLADVGAY